MNKKDLIPLAETRIETSLDADGDPVVRSVPASRTVGEEIDRLRASAMDEAANRLESSTEEGPDLGLYVAADPTKIVLNAKGRPLPFVKALAVAPEP